MNVPAKITLKDFADVLHLFFCNKLHEEDLTKAYSTDKCIYIIGEQLTEDWDLPDKKIWLLTAERLVTKYCAGDVEEITQAIRGFLRLKARYPDLFEELVKLYTCNG